MAKRVGSEDAPKLGAAGAGAPTHGSNIVVTPELYLEAVKKITLAQAKVKAANEEKNGIRKHYKGAGIELGVLDAMVKMAEWSRGEIRDHFAVQARYAEWLGLPVAPGVLRQGDMMAGLDDQEVQRREWFAIGRTTSRTGKPGRPPEECPEEFHQAFMAGFNEEDEAAWSDSETADTKEAPAGDHPPAAANPEPIAQPEAEAAPVTASPVVDWTPADMWKDFSEDPEDWFAAQRRDFDAAYDAIPAGAIVRIAHEGVRKAFLAACQEEARQSADRGEAADVPKLEGEEEGEAEAAAASSPPPAEGKAGKSKPVVH